LVLYRYNNSTPIAISDGEESDVGNQATLEPTASSILSMATSSSAINEQNCLPQLFDSRSHIECVTSKEVLLEMFPGFNKAQISAVLQITGQDLQEAIECLLTGPRYSCFDYKKNIFKSNNCYIHG